MEQEPSTIIRDAWHYHLGRAFIFAACVLATSFLRADQVETQNGDRFMGKVVSLTEDTLTFQNETLGTLTVPRAKVVSITFGVTTPVVAGSAAVRTNSAVLAKPMAAPAPASAAAATSKSSGSLRQLGANTALAQQVRKQLLSDAGPEANAKFDELLGGMANGTITMADIRAQAQSAANQLRALKGQQNDEYSSLYDGYLAILDRFLKDPEIVAMGTNAPSSAAKPKPRATAAKNDEL